MIDTQHHSMPGISYACYQRLPEANQLNQGANILPSVHTGWMLQQWLWTDQIYKDHNLLGTKIDTYNKIMNIIYSMQALN
jgi:hypothetical protein